MRIISLPDDIRRAFGAFQKPNGEFIVLHSLKMVFLAVFVSNLDAAGFVIRRSDLKEACFLMSRFHLCPVNNYLIGYAYRLYGGTIVLVDTKTLKWNRASANVDRIALFDCFDEGSRQFIAVTASGVEIFMLNIHAV